MNSFIRLLMIEFRFNTNSNCYNNLILIALLKDKAKFKLFK